MRKEYDFSNGKKNPYAERLHRNTTIFVEADVVKRFEELAKKEGISRDKLITATLKDYLEQSKSDVSADIK